MMNTFTLDRARRDVAEIQAVENGTDVRAIQLFGHVGGTDRNPITFWGHAVRYVRFDTGDTCFKFYPGDELRRPLQATYVIDGAGYYVAGWQGNGDGTADLTAGGYVLLHPISRIRNIDTGATSEHSRCTALTEPTLCTGASVCVRRTAARGARPVRMAHAFTRIMSATAISATSPGCVMAGQGLSPACGHRRPVR
jgi:hypothetical protein